MSHHPERKEKNCLNCNAEILGRYCQVCGQENLEPKESFWSLLTHFVYDITHFDGKFFSTLKYLLFKPGFLSKEYILGRRTSYLHPIRLYVFTSFVFFLIFFSFYQEKEMIKIKETNDPIAKKTTSSLRDSTRKDSALSPKQDVKIFVFDSVDFDEPKTIAQYDSLQLTLPKNKRAGFFMRMIQHKSIQLNKEYNYDSKAVSKGLKDKFAHLFPQLLFVSLPLFSFFLLLLYIRIKGFFYTDHVVFTIHLYCATFILILLGLLLGSLFKLLHVKEDWGQLVFSLLAIIYWYKAFRNFYVQSRKKTIFKYLLLFLMTLFLIVLLFALFLLVSFFSI